MCNGECKARSGGDPKHKSRRSNARINIKADNILFETSDSV